MVPYVLLQPCYNIYVLDEMDKSVLLFALFLHFIHTFVFLCYTVFILEVEVHR